MESRDNKNISPMVNFGNPTQTNSIIKVIGVGGGGGNAVNHMYREGIHDVTFLVCNLDAQALANSPVPVRLQLGEEGLGAGNKPEKGRLEAENSVEKIKDVLNDGTRMVFITAGMGGGTGTGAAPVIARVAKEMGILTVGIVTIPFLFEGLVRINKALVGVEEMSKHVDSLLVINNERLRGVCSNQSVSTAFAKADDTLSVAAKSIAEIITHHGLINLDFNDVKSVLKDGGVAMMSTGYGEGEGRVEMAINDALNSPLLSDSDVYNSRRILLDIKYSDKEDGSELKMDEMNDVHEFMARFALDYDIKWGMGVDQSLGKKVKVTILATGFGLRNVDGMSDILDKRSQEELDRKAQQENVLNKYYPNDGNAHRRNPHVFRFEPEELDNEEIILAVENTPTYKRSQEQLKDIRNMVRGGVTKGDNDGGGDKIDTIISFA